MFIVTSSLLAVSAIYRLAAPEENEGRIPASGDEVLEHVPARANDAYSKQAEGLRAALAAKPDDVATAVQLAKVELNEGRSRGDPRHIGYATAALAPWWNQAEPPDDILLLRATIKQTMHGFREAIADLDVLLRRDPKNAQAWLTRAVVLAVVGDYEKSEESCRPLGALGGVFVETVCMTNAQSQHGHAHESYERLKSVVSQAPGNLSVAERAWALSTLAEAAMHSGEGAAVEKNLKAALSLDPADHFLVAAYADFLLDAGRADEALKVLGDDTQDDGLLLRRVLALKALGRGVDEADELRSRYAASHQRGDSLHQREEARFALRVDGDATRALGLATANWAIQKEYWDARVLLEASLAVKSKGAALPVLDALERNHAEDPALLGLAAKVKALQ